MTNLVLQNVIGALVVSMLGGGAQWVWRAVIEPRRKRQRRRAVLGFDADESEFAPTVVLESTVPTATSRYQRPTVGYGAVLAMANLAQLIAAVWKKGRRSGRIEVWMDSDQIALRALSEQSQHAIVIGGPLSNRETRRYLEWLNQGVRDGSIELVRQDGFGAKQPTERLAIGRGPIRYEEEDPSRGRALVIGDVGFRAALTSEDGEVVAESQMSALSGTDYGLIIRGPARNRSGRLVIIAGVHTFGLAGASRYLVDLSSLRRYFAGSDRRSNRRDILNALRHLSMPESEDVLLVVRTDFECGVITATELVAVWRIRFASQ